MSRQLFRQKSFASIAALAASLAGLFIASPAFAQDAEAQADAAFARGVDHLRAERFDEAASEFETSNGLVQRAATSCNLGLAYEHAEGREAQALAAYRLCSRLDDEGRFREHAEERAAALEAELAADSQIQRPTEPSNGESGETPSGETDSGTIHILETSTPPPARSRGLLYAGIAVAVIGAAALGGGAALATSAQGDVDQLNMTYTGSEPVVIPAGSPEADTLSSARGKSTAALALYVGGGVALTAGAAMIILDLVQGDGNDDVRVGGSFGPEHAMATVEVSF